MLTSTLVFDGAEKTIDELLHQAAESLLVLDEADVEVQEAAQAVEGEVWSPQLPAYQAWVATESNKADGTTREGDLYSAGALWMGEFDELLAQAAQSEEAGIDGAGNASQGLSLERAGVAKGLRGAISVRQVAGGYALTGFDLHRFAANLSTNQDLVVVLPSFVGGVPIVRVAVEAFARRYVQGVGVRLLVIPNTVEHVAENAFAAMSARRIHVGAKVSHLGEQFCDVAGVSPRLARREYSVDSRNAHYRSEKGNLFSHDGTELVFLACPYDSHVVLPQGVERVRPAAFAEGCDAPSVVDCDEALVRVDSRVWDDAVWRCPVQAPAYRALAKRSVRLAGPLAIEKDGCWYDFDDQGAVLVAGPPKPVSVSRSFAEQAAVRAVAVRGKGEEGAEELEHLSPAAAAAKAANEFAAAGQAGSSVDYVSDRVYDVLSFPRSIEGKPLVRIGVRALPFAPATVVFPDTVRRIEKDNACRETTRLVLPEGLRFIGAHCFWSRKLERPVAIPSSCESIGEGSFEYAVVRLAKTNAIVHVSADQLLSCFLDKPSDGIPFDFDRYDKLLLSNKNLPDKLGALLQRLATPYRLSDDSREQIVALLNQQRRTAQEMVARAGDRAMVEALVKAGFITEESFQSQIELLRSCNRTDCVAYLMEWHRKQREKMTETDGGGKSVSSSRARFAL